MKNLKLTRVLVILSPLPREHVIERFAIALATAVLSVLLRGLLDPVLGHVAFYVTLYVAVAFDAVICGAAPAALSSALGFLGIFYWFVDPRHSLLVARPSEIHGCRMSTCVRRADRLRGNKPPQTATTQSHRCCAESRGVQRQRVEQELREARDQLEQKVEERTKALSQAPCKLESEANVRKQREEQLGHLSVRLMNRQ
jgi:K+-sensing histidine kinase KdpD